MTVKVSSLINGAVYLVKMKGKSKKLLAAFHCTPNGKFWYIIGDEQKVPFGWVTEVIRKIRL